ncbi:MAG: low specificity L-threonine aldolase [Rhodospirillaceae bacterium TMED8]|nr:low specificity L-threonine aldolase [Magnetovibrio sp.]OUT49871.1 MAG: low specificity L-threonine aldolase [Rhodospirillaceae bacterium TMED8]|tara:strand:+ start:379 stop:1419 length:1041 start_codon:yes stop_codon:yes gene_type:complete
MITPVHIDLYSDTHTKPSAAMRDAMASARVGDEQQNADPTTNKLQEMVAEILGKERALFLPSGTMCNAIAVRAWCEPGDEVICDVTAHIINSETGGPAALSGVMLRPVHGNKGIFTGHNVRAALRPVKRNSPISKLVSLENTCNFGGGTIWPVNSVADVSAAALDAGLKRHLDGARLLNATAESGIKPSLYGEYFDSLWIDLSKGLGCPIGGVLAGNTDFIERALRFKHQFGGAMRQSGIIAAAGIYAIENNIGRLKEDHKNARRLARHLTHIPGIVLDANTVQTNIVFFNVQNTGHTANQIRDNLIKRGVHIGAMGEYTMRAVTHLDITERMVDEAADHLATILS